MARLVLSRRDGESITFPELGIVIKTEHKNGSGVRLVVEADKSIRVVRTELLERDREVEQLN